MNDTITTNDNDPATILADIELGLEIQRKKILKGTARASDVETFRRLLVCKREELEKMAEEDRVKAEKREPYSRKLRLKHDYDPNANAQPGQKGKPATGSQQDDMWAPLDPKKES